MFEYAAVNDLRMRIPITTVGPVHICIRMRASSSGDGLCDMLLMDVLLSKTLNDNRDELRPATMSERGPPHRDTDARLKPHNARLHEIGAR